ncbi:hypothetical protein G9A89_006458 [Geosiphon pyriformis]|nr:hypothetical protein G9A89_006458 [Geosiphon pyriformis]
MTHQSGIKESKELADLFANAVKTRKLRIIRVSIVNESLVPNGTIEAGDDWVSDYAKVLSFLEEKIPAYILFRLDSKSSTGNFEWLFLCYVPDLAKVRDKMLYASTRATLTRDLGDNYFVDSIYGTVANDFTYEGYLKHKKHQLADAPLTEREKELAEIKIAEVNSFSSSTRKSHAAGVSFPIADEALVALKQLGSADRTHNLVQLVVDTIGEKFELSSSDNIGVDQLAAVLPVDAPRFSFFAYNYSHNGQEFDSIVFIYTCPSTSKIRERMLYSSSRASIISIAEKEASLEIVKKLETNDPKDLNESFLLNELHPKKDIGIKKFDRPKPPGRRNIRT